MKLDNDQLHSLIMSHMVNNDIDRLIIRQIKSFPNETRLHLHFHVGKDEEGKYIEIKLHKGNTC